MRRGAAVGVVLALCPAPAHAAQRLLGVAPSISAAITQARPGDTIVVPAGTYREQVEIDRRITLRPLGDGAVVIDAECTRDHAIRIRGAAANGARIEGIEVMGSREAAIVVEGRATRRVTIADMRIHDYDCTGTGGPQAAGIASWYAGGLRVLRNRITYRATSPTPVTGSGDGIFLASTGTTPSGGGHLIVGNDIIGGHDGIGGVPFDQRRAGADRRTTIARNVVHHCGDDGIQVAGGGLDVRVLGNRVVGCAVGVATAPLLTGRLVVRRNWLVPDRRGIDGIRACITVGGRGALTIEGNRCNAGDGGVGVVQATIGLGPLRLRGNRIRAGSYAVDLRDVGHVRMDGDRLCSRSGPIARFGLIEARSLDDLRRRTGQERRGRRC